VRVSWFEDLLRKLEVTTLTFVGCNFPNCPRTSIYEATERDLRVVAVTASDHSLDQILTGCESLIGMPASEYVRIKQVAKSHELPLGESEPDKLKILSSEVLANIDDDFALEFKEIDNANLIYFTERDLGGQGGMCLEFYAERRPFIFMDLKCLFSDVLRLLHELGHTLERNGPRDAC
jgi:hypothetical protein